MLYQYLKITVSFLIVIVSCTSLNAQSKNDQLLDKVERQTFEYFWSGAEPNSGLARERINMDDIYPENDKNVVTTGGSGFGIMALIAGIDRGYISKKEGKDRFYKILHFLENADRFHGAWPHWMYGETGKVKPFGDNDNGGDLVETSFLLQGLLAVREYYKLENNSDAFIVNTINRLWNDVDFNWYRNNKNVLYWHWSPDKNWIMNFPVHGFNECLIMYVLGASSQKHAISFADYNDGWAENGAIKKITNYKNDTLFAHMQGNPPYGGPLFWTHYSFLGLNPRGLKDAFIDYGKNNITMSKINYQWCVDNPKEFKGYSANNWGLTASYSVAGYAAHAPNMNDDLGVISPTAAISSIVYTPKESIAAINYWNTKLKDKVWGKYGFYDAFSINDNWFPKKYLAIDQGPAAVMIENYRSGLLWRLFMSAPEVRSGLDKLGFSYKK
jgi:hypothetical protein